MTQQQTEEIETMNIEISKAFRIVEMYENEQINGAHNKRVYEEALRIVMAYWDTNSLGL